MNGEMVYISMIGYGIPWWRRGISIVLGGLVQGLGKEDIPC
jgi:hypothetical protein